MSLNLADQYSKLASSIAETIEGRDFRHVSLIFRKSIPIAIGTNIRKSHPEALAKGYRFSEPHSELRALMKVPYNLRNNLTLINYRFNKRGELRLSKPCSKCLPWCITCFKNIYYSVDNGFEML